MRSIPLRLGPKLNLSLLLFIVVLGAATAALVFFGFHRTQDNAAQTSREGLEREGVRTLLANAETQAYVAQLQFFPAIEWGHQAARYMAVAPYESTFAVAEVPALALDDAGNRHDVRAVRTTDLFVPAGANSDQATRDLQESAPLDTLFPSLMADFPGRLTEDNFRPIALYYIGAMSRLLRASFIDVLGQDYMRTALALGVPARVRYGYALKNALPPFVSMAAMTFGYMFGWAVIVETVFNLPGVSRALLNAIFQRDYPMIQAIVVMITLIFVIAATLADLLQRRLNPRLAR